MNCINNKSCQFVLSHINECNLTILVFVKAITSHLILSMSFFRWVVAVWPDAEIKSSPKYSKCCPKLTMHYFTWAVMLFKRAQKVTEHLDYLWKKFFCQSFQNRPIWSHWVVAAASFKIIIERSTVSSFSYFNFIYVSSKISINTNCKHVLNLDLLFKAVTFLVSSSVNWEN